MKKVAICPFLVVLSLFLIGCQSDETMDRDEVTLKAVYQEYDLNYNMETKQVFAEVAFKTSAYGSYVKLAGNDKISFSVENSQTEINQTLDMQRVQIYWGSRNVPVYKGSTTLKSESNNKMTFNWYDSHTDQTIKTTSELLHPEVLSYSHDIETGLDTMAGEIFELNLRDELTETQSLEVTISNKLSSGDGQLYYSFLGKENLKSKSFTISSGQMRADSNSKEMRQIARKKKRFGNVELDVETEKIVPVLTSGRQQYEVQVKLIDTEKIVGSGNKGGKLRKTIIFPVHEMDITF